MKSCQPHPPIAPLNAPRFGQVFSRQAVAEPALPGSGPGRILLGPALPDPTRWRAQRHGQIRGGGAAFCKMMAQPPCAIGLVRFLGVAVLALSCTPAVADPRILTAQISRGTPMIAVPQLGGAIMPPAALAVSAPADPAAPARGGALPPRPFSQARIHEFLAPADMAVGNLPVLPNVREGLGLPAMPADGAS
jgi:hypothetical protein